MAFPSLLGAIGLLQGKGPVMVSTWVPAQGPAAGLGGGAWGAAQALGGVFTVDCPTGARAQVQLAGGELVTADLVLYCEAGRVAEPAAGGRWPRVTVAGKRFRVLGRRSTEGLHAAAGAHVGLVCVADNGGEA